MEYLKPRTLLYVEDEPLIRKNAVKYLLKALHTSAKLKRL